MFLFVLLTAFSSLSLSEGWWWIQNTQTCNPRFHYWQPFYGTIPPKAYVVGVDRGDVKKYVARVISPDKKTWSAPTTFSEKNLYIYFSWGDKETSVATVDKFIEILCVNRPIPGFGWRSTNKYEMADLERECCLVDGGSGYKDGKRFKSWIGRYMDKGKNYVGAVYPPKFMVIWLVHPFRYVDDFGKSHGISSQFEMLAYDCCTRNWCKEPNKANCCYDIMK